MTKIKKHLSSFLAVVFLVGTIGFAGCNGGVTEEQMQQLNDLKKAVKDLEGNIADLKKEKSDLERQIAEKKAKLEQCEKDKAQTEKNLKAMGY